MRSSRCDCGARLLDRHIIRCCLVCCVTPVTNMTSTSSLGRQKAAASRELRLLLPRTYSLSRSMSSLSILRCNPVSISHSHSHTLLLLLLPPSYLLTMSTSDQTTHLAKPDVAAPTRPPPPAYDFSATQALIDQNLHTNRAHFPPLLNTTLLQAAHRLPTPHTPIWCHRQAGRYLPEFKAARAGVDFFVSCQTPLHASELTVQPLRRLALDAAIIFSDILVIPQLLAMDVQMVAGVGPVITRPLTSPQSVDELREVVEEDVRRDLGYVYTAITLTRHALKGQVPLIGFSGAPFTLFGYMVEGGGSRTWDVARRFMYLYPDATHAVMQRLTDAIIIYLTLQVEAGAQMLEVFDTNVGCLSPHLYYSFAHPYLTRIATAVKQQLATRNLPAVPITVFPRGVTHTALAALSHSDYDVISLDWTVDRRWAREAVGGRKALQGNLDPAALFASDDELRRLTREMLDEFGCEALIANLGHGMLPEHDVRKLEVFVDEVHRYSKQLIASGKAGGAGVGGLPSALQVHDVDGGQ